MESNEEEQMGTPCSPALVAGRLLAYRARFKKDAVCTEPFACGCVLHVSQSKLSPFDALSGGSSDC